MSVHKIRMAGIVAALGAVAVLGATTFASGPAITDAGSANTKTAGITLPDKISPQWRETTVAQGSTALENPSALTNWYGYYNDGPMVPAPGDVQATGHNVEATKSEPDKNTYLVVKGQHGADPKYDYGTHFLYQGHELGTSVGSYITRINLDADAAHRVTKLAETEADGKTRARDRRLDLGPVRPAPALHHRGRRLRRRRRGHARLPVEGLEPLGRAGPGRLRGHPERQARQRLHRRGPGGPAGTVNTHAKQPNSFIYRLLPTTRPTWTRAASCRCCRSRRSSTRVRSSSAATPTPTSCLPTPRICTPTGTSFKTLWVTIHDTEKDGTAAFDANAAAKKAGGTPFKRPENGVFKPGTGFKKFFFTETGDTTLTTEAGTAYGGFGTIQELWQDPKSDKGTLRLFYQSDKTHSSFDNITFFDKTQRDRGPGPGRRPAHLAQCARLGLHVRCLSDYSGGAQPVKVIAEGRDPSATIDSAIGGDLGQRLQQRGRQRDHGHPRVQRRSDGQRPARRCDPEGPRPRLAPLLHPPARRQRDLRGHPRLGPPNGAAGRPPLAGRPLRVLPVLLRRVDADVHVVVVADQRLDDARRAVQRQVRPDEDELGLRGEEQVEQVLRERHVDLPTLVGATSRPSRRG